MSDEDEADQETIRMVASICVRRGHTVADIREYREYDGDGPFWRMVADEMELLEARRQRFRVIPGGTGPFRLPGWQPRLAVIADKHPESGPSREDVPAGQQDGYRM